MTDLPKTPSFRLDGKRALVTGAGRGIGLAAAIRARGQQADALALDVTDLAAVRNEIAARAPYEILINSAGMGGPTPFVETAPERYDAMMGLNVRASYFVAQAVVRGLIAAKRAGSIIHLSSQFGHVAAAGRTVYAAIKHAIEGLTKAMAIELAPHGIRVNALAPTYIETPLTRPILADEKFRAEVLKKIKLGRVGQVEDLMGAIVYLASDVSALVTGTPLVVDGGWTAE